MVKRRHLTADEAVTAYNAVSQIPVRLVSVEIKQVIKLALEFNTYAYDAYFIECAATNRLPLLSIDDGMIRAAQHYGIKIIEV